MLMKRIVTILLLSYSVTTLGQELDWLTDFRKAKAQANQDAKLILMRFTGSDWCANCIR